MIREMRTREEVVHEVVGRVVTHPDLLEDHLALGVDVVRPERRAPQTSARMSIASSSCVSGNRT